MKYINILGSQSRSASSHLPFSPKHRLPTFPPSFPNALFRNIFLETEALTRF